MSDQPRPVWITAEDLLRDPWVLAAVVWEQYKVAPADATEATHVAIASKLLPDHDSRFVADMTKAALRALGMPDA